MEQLQNGSWGCLHQDASETCMPLQSDEEKQDYTTVSAALKKEEYAIIPEILLIF